MDLAEAAQQWVIEELMEDTELQELLACCGVPCSLTSPVPQLDARPDGQAAQPMHLDQQEVVGVELATAAPTLPAAHACLPAGPKTPAVAKAGLPADARAGVLSVSGYSAIGQSGADAAAEAAPRAAGYMIPSATCGPCSSAAQTRAQTQVTGRNEFACLHF